MQKIKAFVPHLFTLGNLFCGCLGIVYAFSWRLDWAAYMVFLAAFLDFFDGFFARILKVPSELGKQLDSLADMVSFGVVPGVVMFQWLRHLVGLENSLEGIGLWGLNKVLNLYYDVPWQAYIALLIPLFSCYRLAKFNLDTRQSHGFIGLPTPANAIFFTSLVLIASFFPYATDSFWELPRPEMPVNAGMVNHLAHGPSWTIYPPDDINGLSSMMIACIMNKFVVIGLIVVFSVLLVAELPLFALKFKNFGWNDNKIRYIFLVLAAVLLICFWLTAIPFIVILYLLLSVLNNLFKITV